MKYKELLTGEIKKISEAKAKYLLNELDRIKKLSDDELEQ